MFNTTKKYPELTELCKSCLGCNKLEDINFKGYSMCDNHMKGTKDGPIQQSFLRRRSYESI